MHCAPKLNQTELWHPTTMKNNENNKTHLHYLHKQINQKGNSGIADTHSIGYFGEFIYETETEATP